MNNNKKSTKKFIIDHAVVISISFILIIIILLSGILDAYYGTKEIFKVTVVDVSDKIIMVAYGNKNGDPVKVEVKRPLLQRIQKYDYISVYDDNGVLKIALFKDKLEDIFGFSIIYKLEDIFGISIFLLITILIFYSILYGKLKSKKDVYFLLFGITAFFSLSIFYIITEVQPFEGTVKEKIIVYIALFFLPVLFGILYFIEKGKNYEKSNK